MAVGYKWLLMGRGEAIPDIFACAHNIAQAKSEESSTTPALQWRSRFTGAVHWDFEYLIIFVNIGLAMAVLSNRLL